MKDFPWLLLAGCVVLVAVASSVGRAVLFRTKDFSSGTRASLEFASIVDPNTPGARFIPMAMNAERLAVDSVSLFSGPDILDVRAVTKSRWTLLGGRTYLSEVILTVTPQAAERLRSLRADGNMHSYALVVDGTAIEQILMRGPIEGTSLSIAGALTSVEAKALAKKISAAL